jgi:hypothetical protein
MVEPTIPFSERTQTFRRVVAKANSPIPQNNNGDQPQKSATVSRQPQKTVSDVFRIETKRASFINNKNCWITQD